MATNNQWRSQGNYTIHVWKKKSPASKKFHFRLDKIFLWFWVNFTAVIATSRELSGFGRRGGRLTDEATLWLQQQQLCGNFFLFCRGIGYLSQPFFPCIQIQKPKCLCTWVLPAPAVLVEADRQLVGRRPVTWPTRLLKRPVVLGIEDVFWCIT